MVVQIFAQNAVNPEISTIKTAQKSEFLLGSMKHLTKRIEILTKNWLYANVFEAKHKMGLDRRNSARRMEKPVN